MAHRFPVGRVHRRRHQMYKRQTLDQGNATEKETAAADEQKRETAAKEEEGQQRKGSSSTAGGRRRKAAASTKAGRMTKNKKKEDPAATAASVTDRARKDPPVAEAAKPEEPAMASTPEVGSPPSHPTNQPTNPTHPTNQNPRQRRSLFRVCPHPLLLCRVWLTGLRRSKLRRCATRPMWAWALTWWTICRIRCWTCPETCRLRQGPCGGQAAKTRTTTKRRMSQTGPTTTQTTSGKCPLPSTSPTFPRLRTSE